MSQGNGHVGGLDPRPSMRVDALDREFDALPAPPKTKRLFAMAAMAASSMVALVLLAFLRADVAYLFASPRPANLGEAHALSAAGLNAGAFVRISGTPMASKTVLFHRPLGGETFAIFPLAGQRNVYVQVAAGSADEARRSARRDFSGRLVTFGALGARIGPVRTYLRDVMHLPVTGESFLLIADEAPGTPTAAHGVALLCALCVVMNAGMAIRWFRPRA